MARNVVRTTTARKTPAVGAPTTSGTNPNGYGVTKVNRQTRPANDNPRPFATSRFSRELTASNDNRLRNARMAKTEEVATKAVNVVNATAATWFIMGTTWIFYIVQFVFALLYLVIMGGLSTYENSALETLDILGWGGEAGVEITLLCMGVMLAMWFCTFTIAAIVYFLRGVRMSSSASQIVLLASLVLILVPAAGLVPWVWVWCASVIKTQVD